MKTVSLQLPEQLHRQLERLAKQRGQSKSELMRAALEEFFGRGHGTTETVSALDLAGDRVGSCDGPGDLSTSEKYMEGFGR